MELQTAARYRLLDELRGLDLISMMLYHGMWDVVFLFGVAQKWYTGRPGFVWQQSICWVFILLSGFCLPLGHRPLRRGLLPQGISEKFDPLRNQMGKNSPKEAVIANQ